MPLNFKYPPGYDLIAELLKIDPAPSMIMNLQTLSIVAVNEATTKLLGYSEKELLGKSVMDLIPAEDISVAQRAIEEPVPEGETQWRCLYQGRQNSPRQDQISRDDVWRPAG